MIYFLYGENSYLSLKKLHELRDASLGANPMINISNIEGDEVVSINDILASSQMSSFFSDEQLIIIKRFFKNKSKKLQECLALELKNHTNDNIIFWDDSSVDKRSRLFKELKRVAKIYEYKELNIFKLKEWLLNLFTKENIEISQNLIDKCINMIGTNQFLLSQEVNKLILFLQSKNKKVVDINDIKEVIILSKEESIWELMDNLSFGNNKKALLILERLLTAQSDFPLILSLILRQLRILYLVKIHQERSSLEIAKVINLHPFIVTKYCKAAKRLSIIKIKRAFEKLLNLDFQIKQGIIEAKLGLDLFILSF